MNIVVGYHDTPVGRAALDRAVSRARESSGTLHLVSYVPMPQDEQGAKDYEGARAEQARKLSEVAGGLSTEGLECRTHVPAAVKGPAEAILSVARAEGADLIVIGMRRRSRVGKLVLGSTAQDVLLGSECDVLSVKAPTEP